MFRVLLALLTAIAWVAAFAVAAHESTRPSVLGRWSGEWTIVVIATLLIALSATAAHRRPWYEKLRARRRQIALLVAAAAALLALAEGALRAFDPFGLSYFAESTRYQRDKVADPDLLFHHRPGLVANYAGVRVAINELGLRDDPLDPRPQGEFRVLALGDSVTLGWGVAKEATWCEQLEARMAGRRGGLTRVVDAGCGGFDSLQELALLRRVGDAVAPDLVLLLYVQNDVEINRPGLDQASPDAAEGRSLPQAVMALLKKSWLFRLGYYVVHSAQGPAAPPQPRPPGWRRSLDAVAAMNDWCRERRIPFVVFLWRPRADPLNEALLAELYSLGRNRSIPVVDTRPWLENIPPRELTLSVVDAHPTPRTHARLAEQMVEALDRRGLVAR
jgi:lysophospholipase L1-like esterase